MQYCLLLIVARANPHTFVHRFPSVQRCAWLARENSVIVQFTPYPTLTTFPCVKCADIVCERGGGASHVLGAHITSDIRFIECFFFVLFFAVCTSWLGGGDVWGRGFLATY